VAFRPTVDPVHVHFSEQVIALIPPFSGLDQLSQLGRKVINDSASFFVFKSKDKLATIVMLILS
jgi:hypothetical protein